MATFYNQATLSYSGGVVQSNITQGEIIQSLSANKTAVVGEYSQNENVTYAINIINSGTTAFNGITVTDNLGEYTFNNITLRPTDYVEGSIKYFINGVLQNNPTITDESPLVITGIRVPANGVTTLLYTVTINNFAPISDNSTITNTATISGNCISDITVTETITVATNPLLNINKTLSPTTLSQCERLTYTIQIQNFGNTATTINDNVVITDTFNPILSNLAVTYNDNPWSSPANYTYNQSTGVFQTVAGQITVPAATYSRNPITGEWTITPGVATITISGNI